MSRLGYDGDEGLWFDREKSVEVEGEVVFMECDPEELVDELEGKLKKALEFAGHRHECDALAAIWNKSHCDCGWEEARKEIST